TRVLISTVAASGSRVERGLALSCELSQPQCQVALLNNVRWDGKAKNLLADAELTDDIAVANGVADLQVVQKTAPLAYQHQETTAGCVILLVHLEMLRELADALTEDRDLYFGAPGVGLMGPEAGDNFALSLCCQHAYLSTLSVVSTL